MVCSDPYASSSQWQERGGPSGLGVPSLILLRVVNEIAKEGQRCQHRMAIRFAPLPGRESPVHDIVQRPQRLPPPVPEAASGHGTRDSHLASGDS